jgi:uncharacterized membrane protein YdbT with pleckstrin-like domain
LGYVETILEPGERITHRAYLHWIIYARAVVPLLIGALMMMGSAVATAAGSDAAAAGLIGLLAFLLGAMALLLAVIDRWTTEIAVTNQRVIMKRGLIRRDTIEINMPKVESVDVRQSVLGRLLNYGTVIVCGTGGSPNTLGPFVAEPLPLRRAVTLAVQAEPPRPT